MTINKTLALFAMTTALTTYGCASHAINTNGLTRVEENHAVIEKDGVRYQLDSYIVPFQQPYHIHIERTDHQPMTLQQAENIALDYIKPRGCTVPLVRRPELDQSNQNGSQRIIGVAC